MNRALAGIYEGLGHADKYVDKDMDMMVKMKYCEN